MVTEHQTVSHSRPIFDCPIPESSVLVTRGTTRLLRTEGFNRKGLSGEEMDWSLWRWIVKESNRSGLQ